MTVLWLDAAARNRFEQLDYIAQDNPAAAIRLDEQIEGQAGMLADDPLMGRIGRVKGTRELVISHSPFILVYRIRRKRLEILRLLHGAQQWPRAESVEGA